MILIFTMVLLLLNTKMDANDDNIIGYMLLGFIEIVIELSILAIHLSK